MFDASAIAVTRYISARRMARLSWSGWHSHTSKYLTGSAWCNFIGCLMHWPLLHTTCSGLPVLDAWPGLVRHGQTFKFQSQCLWSFFG